MIPVLVSGAAGRMGESVLRAVDAHAELRVVAALERAGHPRLGQEVAPGVKLGSDLDAALGAARVVIDFSSPECTLRIAEGAARRGVALVSGTTGIGAPERAHLEATAERIPVLLSANFSLGVNVLVDLLAEAARRLPDYDLEILEMHHGEKADAPSGTALRLAQVAAQARGVSLDEHVVYHRQGQTGRRKPGSIGMQTLRAGDSVGEHTVYLAGPGERLELSHRALSRMNFANGAVHAAAWLVGRPARLYSMSDVLGGAR